MSFLKESYPRTNWSQLVKRVTKPVSVKPKVPPFNSIYDKYGFRQPDDYSCWITALRTMYAIRNDEDIRSKFKTVDERYDELERFITEVFMENKVTDVELLNLRKIRNRNRGLSPYFVGTFLNSVGLSRLRIVKKDLGEGAIDPISVKNFSIKTIDDLLEKYGYLYVVIKPSLVDAGYHAYVIVNKEDEYYQIIESGFNNLFLAHQQGVFEKIKDMIEHVQETTIGYFE
jgi:hypothetical protein